MPRIRDVGGADWLGMDLEVEINPAVVCCAGDRGLRVIFRQIMAEVGDDAHEGTENETDNVSRSRH